MKEAGYVYIFTNPSFREDWLKIGKSSRPVNVRPKELDNTPVSLPFEIIATLQAVKYGKVEKLLHKTIDKLTDLRIRQNREFYKRSQFVKKFHPVEKQVPSGAYQGDAYFEYKGVKLTSLRGRKKWNQIQKKDN